MAGGFPLLVLPSDRVLVPLALPPLHRTGQTARGAVLLAPDPVEEPMAAARLGTAAEPCAGLPAEQIPETEPDRVVDGELVHPPERPARPHRQEPKPGWLRQRGDPGATALLIHEALEQAPEIDLEPLEDRRGAREDRRAVGVAPLDDERGRSQLMLAAHEEGVQVRTELGPSRGRELGEIALDEVDGDLEAGGGAEESMLAVGIGAHDHQDRRHATGTATGAIHVLESMSPSIH